MGLFANGAGAPVGLSGRCGVSRLRFRDPQPVPSGEYIVALGGSESFGPADSAPFPALIGGCLGVEVANLACLNGGPDAYLNDPATLGMAAGARAVIIQVMGALNLTNRYYCVHPRRNDRFIAAAPPLRALYPDVDFTDIHFTRHLAQTLFRRDAGRFAMVAEELRRIWLARMRALLQQLPPRRLLLWMAADPPPERARGPLVPPELVDRAMVSALCPLVSGYVERVGPPGAAMHDDAAAALAPLLARLI